MKRSALLFVSVAILASCIAFRSWQPFRSWQHRGAAERLLSVTSSPTGRADVDFTVDVGGQKWKWVADTVSPTAETIPLLPEPLNRMARWAEVEGRVANHFMDNSSVAIERIRHDAPRARTSHVEKWGTKIINVSKAIEDAMEFALQDRETARKKAVLAGKAWLQSEIAAARAKAKEMNNKKRTKLAFNPTTAVQTTSSVKTATALSSTLATLASSPGRADPKPALDAGKPRQMGIAKPAVRVAKPQLARSSETKPALEPAVHVAKRHHVDVAKANVAVLSTGIARARAHLVTELERQDELLSSWMQRADADDVLVRDSTHGQRHERTTLRRTTVAVPTLRRTGSTLTAPSMDDGEVPLENQGYVF